MVRKDRRKLNIFQPMYQFCILSGVNEFKISLF